MSSKAQSGSVQKSSNSRIFQRQKAKPGARALTSATILADIAEFKKRGGRIEVLGNTPYRTIASTAFSSRRTAARRKPPTPVVDAVKSSN